MVEHNYIPTLGKLKQEDCVFRGSLGYRVLGQPELHSDILLQKINKLICSNGNYSEIS
jgi:hypothetical protein